ncbi:MAG: alpha/beta hydrolase [Chitinophagaceae bacterium]|nr:alpha/beta hydrolase [Chitinophagaceae bacterium]
MKSKLMIVVLAIFTGLAFTGCEKELKSEEPGMLVPKTVDEDPSLPSITINGTQLHAETFGNPDSAMVVFLHGGPGGDYRSALQVKQLAANGYYVVFYDQRGAGLSKRQDKDRYSIDMMLDDLAGVIQHYRRSPAQKIFLFGHSWGAILATAYINAHPTAVNGVILAEPSGLTWNELKEYGRKTRTLELFSEAANDVVYRDQFLTAKENEHALLDYKLALNSAFEYAAGNAEGVEGPWPFWRFGAVSLKALSDIGERDGMNVTVNLSQFHAKALFLYGEYNKAYGLTTAEHQAQYFSSSQITKIAGTGHEMIYFRWDLVYPAVLTYLNALK